MILSTIQSYVTKEKSIFRVLFYFDSDKLTNCSSESKFHLRPYLIEFLFKGQKA